MDEFKNQVVQQIRELWSGKNYDILWCMKISSQDKQMERRLKALDEELSRFTGRRHFILAVEEVEEWFGISCAGTHRLQHDSQLLLLPRSQSGIKTEYMAYLEAACGIQADLVILPDTFPLDDAGKVQGSFLAYLMEALQGPYDCAAGFLRQAQKEEWEQCYLGPVIEAFYGVHLSASLPGAWGIRLETAEELRREIRFHIQNLTETGVIFWMLTRMFLWKKQLQTFKLPPESTSVLQKKADWEWVQAVFYCIREDRNYCQNSFYGMKVPDFRRQFEDSSQKAWSRTENAVKQREGRTRKNILSISEMQDFYSELPSVWKDIFQNLYSFRQREVSAKDWAELQIWLLLKAEENSGSKEKQSCILKLWEMGWSALEFSHFSLKPAGHIEVQLEGLRREITRQLCRSKQQKAGLWQRIAEKNQDDLLPMYYMEYVPGRPWIIPQKILVHNGQSVGTEQIYKELRIQFEKKMQNFLNRAFGHSITDSPSVLRASMQSFVEQTEKMMEEVFPGNLHTRQGLENFIENLGKYVPAVSVIVVQESLLREMLVRFPPVPLMLSLHLSSIEELFQKMQVQEAAARADLLEENAAKQEKYAWLAEHLRPENFTLAKVQTLTAGENQEAAGWHFGRISDCYKTSGKILLRCLPEGKGGKYPRLRYFFEWMHRMAQLQIHSEMMVQCIQQRREVGRRFVHSLDWEQQKQPFSAAQIFENFHHRRLGQMMRQAAGRLQQKKQMEMARRLRLMAYGYGVSQVLKDGSFLTCTLWSWAGYSFKGGSSIPYALTTSIEERWFHHAFLEAVCRRIGIPVTELFHGMKQQILTGNAQKSLWKLCMPESAEQIEVLSPNRAEEPAGTVKRYEKNPILEPVPEHSWENKYVLNPGALRIGNRVYLFYRAVGNDGISRIGLAVTDGYRVLKRFSEPIFSPQAGEEKRGCEDPRVVLIEDKIWMIYTAYDGNIAQIAAAQIRKKDFLQENFQWKREGLAFRDIWDKDAVLFPEKVRGKYILYHRIEPSIWYTELENLQFPCRERQIIIAGPRPGQQWDSLKIGAGAQPLKTVFGWLLFYHGVDQNYVYRLGILLADLEEPQKILYRSPNAVLEPETSYELGKNGAWVPNVVFTCGAVSAEPKEILEENDKVIVYYGAADSSIGAAEASIADLIPEKYRRK